MFIKDGVGLVKRNGESFLRQTYGSKSNKLRRISIYFDRYFDRYFIHNLYYYRIFICKMIAIPRRDTFFSCSLDTKKSNLIVVRRQTHITFIELILSNLLILFLFFISDNLFSHPLSSSLTLQW